MGKNEILPDISSTISELKNTLNENPLQKIVTSWKRKAHGKLKLTNN